MLVKERKKRTKIQGIVEEKDQTERHPTTCTTQKDPDDPTTMCDDIISWSKEFGFKYRIGSSIFAVCISLPPLFRYDKSRLITVPGAPPE